MHYVTIYHKMSYAHPYTDNYPATGGPQRTKNNLTKNLSYCRYVKFIAVIAVKLPTRYRMKFQNNLF